VPSPRARPCRRPQPTATLLQGGVELCDGASGAPVWATVNSTTSSLRRYARL
jgi:hypothetical protein